MENEKQFYRPPEEMRHNYEEAQVYYGDEDPSKDGTREKDQVFPTAFMTIRNFAEQTNIPYATELYDAFYEKMGFKKGEYEPETIDTPHFLELRYLSTEKVLREASEKGDIGQVLELASGFTPHSISVCNSMPQVQRYIENDFEVNTKVKQKVVNELVGGIPVRFCPGNILDAETWKKFEENLIDEPVAIFAEGLMMYLSEEERMKLLENVKKLLEKRGGFFMHEDILKYHPELKENPRFARITNKLKSVSKNTALDEKFTQEGVTQFYESMGFVVERIPEDVELSYDQYPEEAKENAKELLKAGFNMWKLSIPR